MMRKAAIFLFAVRMGLGSLQGQTIYASDFGYNTADATAAIKNAILSAADTIVVDKQAEPWRVGPLRFWDLSDKTIIFEPGVLIEALPGAFNGYYDCLFRFAYCDNIHLSGYGATFKMHRDEYAAIDDSEYRHSILFYSSSHVSVRGLTLEESGGDGIAIDGDGLNFCENIWIEDVRCLNHYRQGMSVMNAQNMRVRHCEFSGTAGALPEAGIDIEPYQTQQRIVNLLIENCRFENNGWSGIAVNLFELDGGSTPVDIVVRDCVFKNNCRPQNAYAKCEIYASDDPLSPVQGNVLFERCFVVESDYSAFYSRKTADAYGLTFRDCVFQNVSKLQTQYNEPIFLEVADYANPSPPIGGMAFERMLVAYQSDFSFFRIFGWPTLQGIKDIVGHFTVVEPTGYDPLFQNVGIQNNIAFTYSNQPSLPPTTASLASFEKNAVECSQQPAVLEFSRISTDISYPLGLSYALSGSATEGDDFHIQTLGIVLPSDTEVTTLSILARADMLPESTETVQITLQDAPLYEPGVFNSETIYLWDCNPLSAAGPIRQDRRLSVCPNPSDDAIWMTSSGDRDPGLINIYDLSGKTALTVKAAPYPSPTALDIRKLLPGLYFLTYKGERVMFVKQ
ncbi:MAG: right-handed parallel beta-helix repeat-containing protein [Saprospiraceae bacterium]